MKSVLHWAKRHRLLMAGLLVAAAALVLLPPKQITAPANEINTFEECAKHYPVQESFPRVCRVPGGASFTEAVE